jgi:hypothetical protein
MGLPVLGGVPNAVQVDSTQIARAITVARQAVTVRSVLAKIIDDTVDCGFEIVLRYNNDSIEMRESEKHIIKNKWPSFVRDVLWHIYVVGFVVIGRDRATGVPHVESFSNVTVNFADTPGRPREYWAENVGAPLVNSGGGGARRRRMNARVYVHFAPDEAGNLTSSVSAVMKHAVALERVLNNQQVADYHRTHPTWVYEGDHDKSLRPDPTEHDHTFEGEVAEAYHAWQEMITNQQQSMFAQTQQRALSAYAQNMSSVGTFLNYSMAPAEAQLQPPWLNYTFVPIGTRIAPGTPTPQQNAHLQEEIEMYSSMILMEFRIPPMEMEISHAVRYQTQPDAARRHWGKTVRNIQRTLSDIISDVYLFSNSDVMTEYAVSMLRNVQQLRKEAVQTVREMITESSGGDDAGDKKRQKRSATAAADDDKKRVPSAEQLIAEAAEGVAEVKPPQKNDDGVLQFPETGASLQRAKQVLDTDDSDIIAYVQQRFRVTVQFCTRPTFDDPETLRSLMNDNVMTMDDYAKYAADLLGMQHEAVLTNQEDRLSEAKDRAKLKDALLSDAERAKLEAKGPTASSSSSAVHKKKRKSPTD